MAHSLPDLCDQYPEQLMIVEPGLKDFGAVRRFSGEVETVKCYEDNSRVKETLAANGTGKVLVVDGGGSLRCALLGDMLATMAARNGWRGIVVNGCVRDVEVLRAIDIGVRALDCHPRRSRKRGQGQVGVPVNFAGVIFRSGQYLYADENGLAVAEHELPAGF
jgi:regulator of ribonuclease activity A